jgi:hypothetical protein
MPETLLGERHFGQQAFGAQDEDRQQQLHPITKPGRLGRHPAAASKLSLALLFDDHSAPIPRSPQLNSIITIP